MQNSPSAKTAPISNKEGESNKEKKEIKDEYILATPSVADIEVNKFIDLFKGISPINYKSWFNNVSQRSAAKELLALAPLEKYELLVNKLLPKLNVEPYIPSNCKAFSPYELKKNFDRIAIKVKELQNNSRTVGSPIIK